MAHHEKADVIITQMIAKAAQSGVKRINAVCEVTDVYVHLILLFYAKLNLSCCFTMEGTSAERTTIDINWGNCTLTWTFVVTTVYRSGPLML
jgi:hypothetical protein